MFEKLLEHMMVKPKIAIGKSARTNAFGQFVLSGLNTEERYALYVQPKRVQSRNVF